MKDPRKDDLPPFGEERTFTFQDPIIPGPHVGRTEIAHHREVDCRFNGPPVKFVAVMEKLGARVDADAIAGAVFAAYREAEIDAAARHPRAPHRESVKAQHSVEIEALEAIRRNLLVLQKARRGGYSADRAASLLARRGKTVPGEESDLSVIGTYVQVRQELARLRPSIEGLHAGGGDAKRTQLRLFAERLVPVYVEATGKAVTGQSSAYENKGELASFGAFLAAACELVTGFVPGRTLTESVAKVLAKKPAGN